MIYIISGEPYQAEQFVKELKNKKIQEKFEYYFFDTTKSGIKKTRSHEVDSYFFDTTKSGIKKTRSHEVDSYFFDAEEEKGENIFKLLDSPSIFNKHKIIFVRISGYEFFAECDKKYENGIGEDILIFFAPSLKSPTIKKGKEHIEQYHFEAPKGSAMRDFIIKESQRRGFMISEEILSSFLRMSADLFFIANEIEKISLANTHYKEIMISQSVENPFELTNALAGKKKTDVLKILESEFEKGTKGIDIMSRILWQLRVLVLVSTYDPQATSYKLPFHPFVIQKARQALRLFSLLELKELYINAISLYEQLIFSSLPSQLLLSRFFWRF